MSYQSLRKLREWGRLWQDPEARNPTSISEAPVAPVGIVNAPFEAAVYAHADLTITNPAPATTVLWDFVPQIEEDQGIPTTAGALPESLAWWIFMAAGRGSDTASSRLRILPTNPFGGNLGGHFSLALQLEAVAMPLTASQMSTGVGAAAQVPFWLPWGGLFVLHRNNSTTAEVVLWAAGFLRGSIAGPS